MIEWAKYSDYLVAQGREDELGEYVLCRCQRRCLPEDMNDVREDGDVPGSFRCGVCTSAKERQLIAEAEANAAWPSAEDMAGLRAERNRRLNESDWVNFPENVARLQAEPADPGPTMFDNWIAYRAAVRDVVVQARDHQEQVDFPPRPDEQ